MTNKEHSYLAVLIHGIECRPELKTIKIFEKHFSMHPSKQLKKCIKVIKTLVKKIEKNKADMYTEATFLSKGRTGLERSIGFALLWVIEKRSL